MGFSSIDEQVRQEVARRDRMDAPVKPEDRIWPMKADLSQGYPIDQKAKAEISGSFMSTTTLRNLTLREDLNLQQFTVVSGTNGYIETLIQRFLRRFQHFLQSFVRPSNTDSERHTILTYVSIESLFMWEDNPIERSLISNADLDRSISIWGFLDVLKVVRRNAGGWIVIEGNRRLEILRRRGYKLVPVLILPFDESEAKAVAIALNTSGKSWNFRAVCQAVVAEPSTIASLPDSQRKRVIRASQTLGENFASYMQYGSPGAMEAGKQLATYLGIHRNSWEEIKDIVIWINHWTGGTSVVHKAMILGTPPEEIRRAIADDRPLVLANVKAREPKRRPTQPVEDAVNQLLVFLSEGQKSQVQVRDYLESLGYGRGSACACHQKAKNRIRIAWIVPDATKVSPFRKAASLSIEQFIRSLPPDMLDDEDVIMRQAISNGINISALHTIASYIGVTKEWYLRKEAQ